jgi:hypothetical protein
MYNEKFNWNKSSTQATQYSRTKNVVRSAQDYKDSWLQRAYQCKGLEQLSIKLGIKSYGHHVWKNLVREFYSGGGETKIPNSTTRVPKIPKFYQQLSDINMHIFGIQR